MSCHHIDALNLSPPGPNNSVYREDCTQCFDSVDDPTGLNVCLSCFNGGCVAERDHALLHYQSAKHPLTLNIQRKRKRVARDEPPQKMSKLAIAAETETDRYDVITRVDCYDCKLQEVDKTKGKLPEVVDGVLRANTFARQEEVKAWEQEMTPCEHTLCLEQAAAKPIGSQDLSQCAKCDLKENLWLCLVCGNLGCGRAQFGGVGGNSHGLAHADEAHHPVAVKLGSLTADGTADIYCYSCNEERTDPELASHLSHWGINIADRQKTEKSLTELQIEQNLRWEFSMTTEDGKEMQPVFGPGFTGLKNLGNSCYLASVLQCLFDMPEFARRYYHPNDKPPAASKPAEDLETQLRKVADGLLSGRYSKPDSDVEASAETSETPHQKGLAPAMLKHLIGQGHAEFSTMRQQDAFELFLHLMQQVSRSPHPKNVQDPVEVFKFCTEQRLQCLACKKVRYSIEPQENITIPVPIRRLQTSNSANENPADDTSTKDEFEPVTFTECLDIFTASEKVELTCPSCASRAGFTKRSLFKTFPQVLAVNARRFDLVNWIPTKMDVPVIFPKEDIPFDTYKSQGQQPDEESLPETHEVADAVGGSSSGSRFTPNETALAQLETMGFPRVRCEKALEATGNQDAEMATAWLFEHMEDPNIDEPMVEAADEPPAGNSGGGTSHDPEKIEQLGTMGFSAPLARQALRETGGDMERAVDWLFSHPDAQGDFGGGDAAGGEGDDQQAQDEGGKKKLPGTETPEGGYRLQSIVCHKGSSIHAGHYVAFIRKHLPHSSSLSSSANNPSTSITSSSKTSNPRQAQSTLPASNTDLASSSNEAKMKEEWVLFNDEKVARGADAEEMKKFAYIYFLRRQLASSSG